MVDEDEDEDDEIEDDREDLTVDLTKDQVQESADSKDQMDEYDLLDAEVDWRDIKTRMRVQELKDELEMEQVRIKMKQLWKLAFQPSDPLRVIE